MNVSQRVAKNFAALSVAEILSRVFTAFLSIYVGRLLGSEALGQLAFATALVSFFSIFADFGLSTLGIRRIAQDKSQTNGLVTNITVLQTALSIVLFLLLLIITWWLPLDIRTRWMVVFFGLGMIPQALTIAFVFQGHERMELAAITRVVSQIAYLVIGYATVYITRDILYLPLVLFFTSLLGAIMAFILSRRYLEVRVEKVDKTLMKSLAIASLPFLFSAIAVQVYYNLDQVLLKFWQGDAVVGYYSAAYKVPLLIIMISGMMVTALFPLLSSSYRNDKTLFSKTITEWSRLNGIIAWPITVGGVLLAKQILLLLYNRPEFLQATFSFQILITLPLLIFWSGLYGHPLIAAGKETITRNGLVMAALINLLANLVLIPRYSLNGAAVATLLAEIAVLAYLTWQYWKYLDVAISRRFVVKPLIAATGMGLVIWIVRDSLPVMLSVMIGAVIYGALLLLIGGVNKQDVQFLRARSS